MSNYCIAGLNISIEPDSSPILSGLQLFKRESQSQPDLSIGLMGIDCVEKLSGKIIADGDILWVQNAGEDGTSSIYATNELGTIITRADIDGQWRHGNIKYLNFSNLEPDGRSEIMTAIYTDVLLGILFRYNLLFHEGIVLHASTISYLDKGIVFTAPSGTGKSTQTRLWQECFGERVRILNDDTPAVRILQGEPWVFGTPWSGSSNIHCNESAPLSLIVIVQQAQVNRIVKLDQHEALMNLMPRCFLPYFSRGMLDLACDIIEKIVGATPVIRLECRPDQEAVELVHQCLMS